MNGDGVVNGSDVGPFESALANIASYHTSYPDLDGYARGDFDGNGSFGAGDIAGFEATLAGNGDELEAAPAPVDAGDTFDGVIEIFHVEQPLPKSD